MARLNIPGQLRPLVDNQHVLELPGSTVGEVLHALVDRYPAAKDRIFNEDGDIDVTLAIAVDGEVEKHYLTYRLRPDSELSIIPAIGGG